MVEWRRGRSCREFRGRLPGATQAAALAALQAPCCRARAARRRVRASSTGAMAGSQGWAPVMTTASWYSSSIAQKSSAQAALATEGEGGGLRVCVCVCHDCVGEHVCLTAVVPAHVCMMLWHDKCTTPPQAWKQLP